MVRSIHPSLDYACIAMVNSLPDLWQPSVSRGFSDTVCFVIPLQFDPSTLKPEPVTGTFDGTIARLLELTQEALDSMLYASRPEVREPYVP